MNGAIVSGIAVICAVVLFIYLAMKGMNIIYGSIICALIVAIFSINGFSTGFFTTYATGVSSFLKSNFLMMTTGALFAGLMNITGCNDKIGRQFVKLLGKDNAVYAIILITYVLGITNANNKIIVAYLAFGLMSAAGLPRYIAMVATLGTSNIAQYCTSGSLCIGNIIPTSILGTSIYAGPVLSVVSIVVYLVLLVIYIRYLIIDAHKKNIGYDSFEGDTYSARPDEDLPKGILAWLPLLLIVVLSFVLIQVGGMSSTNAVSLSAIAASLLSIILFHKSLSANSKSAMDAVSNTLFPMLPCILGTAAVMGFATTVQETNFFVAAENWLLGLNVHPYVLVVLGMFVLSAICSDAIGGTTAFMSILGTKIAEMPGVSAAIVHRLGCISAVTFDSLPHNGGIVMTLEIFHYSHKEGYKYVAVSTIIIPFITTIISLLVAVLFL